MLIYITIIDFSVRNREVIAFIVVPTRFNSRPQLDQSNACEKIFDKVLLKIYQADFEIMETNDVEMHLIIRQLK